MRKSEGQPSRLNVFVRVKPHPTNKHKHSEKQISLKNTDFTFDKILPAQYQQHQVFEEVGQKLISYFLQGYHCCLIAYGQSGSGKTHTMIGQGAGLMQRSFFEVFSDIGKISNQYSVECSYYQIYNQDVLDLLADEKNKKLEVRQNKSEGFFVQGLLKIKVQSPEQLVQFLRIGTQKRHLNQTRLNNVSSRSHSIFQINICMTDNIDGKKSTTASCLKLVDLAGSQNLKKTQASGDIQTEGKNINKSLYQLRNVISNLSNPNPTGSFRNATLTKLLKQCLTNNSKAFFIITISSDPNYYQQSLNSLKFANNVKKIRIKACINRSSEGNNQNVTEQLNSLRSQNVVLKNKINLQAEHIKNLEEREISWQVVGSQQRNDRFKQKCLQFAAILRTSERKRFFDQVREKLRLEQKKKKVEAQVGKNGRRAKQTSDFIDELTGILDRNTPAAYWEQNQEKGGFYFVFTDEAYLAQVLKSQGGRSSISSFIKKLYFYNFFRKSVQGNKKIKYFRLDPAIGIYSRSSAGNHDLLVKIKEQSLRNRHIPAKKQQQQSESEEE